MSKKIIETKLKIAGSVDPSYNKSVSAASQKLSELSKGASALESALAAVGVTAAITATAQALMECAAAAAEYESALAKISTIADPAQASMTEISDGIMELSQNTGQSVTDLSESVYQAMSASVETAGVVDFGRQANMLAVGGLTDTTTAVDVLTTAINAYGLETDQAAEISDMLITTQKLGKTTVGELGSTLGSVIPTAAAYNVNMQNVSAAMVEMTKQGISTAEAGTELRAMLSELAKDSSGVSKVLREETGKSFSDLMGEGKSLGDVLDILGTSVDNDSTAFANLFSNARAKTGALMLFNAGAKEFNGTVEEMQSSLGATADAYGKMENTAEHAQKVFTNSADNLKIAIGEQLSPAITKIYEIGAKVMQGVTAFVKEHPEAVAAVTGVAVAVGAFAVALIGYTAASKVAAVATAALTAVMDTNPIFLAISAFAALALGIAAFAAAADNAAGRGKELTETSKQQKEELDKLNQKYDEAVEKYGKTSKEAQELKGEINLLTEEFKTSQQTYGDLLSDQSKVSDSFAKLLEEDKTDELDDEAATAGILVKKLFALADQSDLTSASQEKMQAIIAKLNTEYEGLNLTYDDIISKTARTKEALESYLKALYNKEKYENAQKQWVETYDLLEKQEAQYKKLQEEAEALKKKQEENETYGTYNDGSLKSSYHDYLETEIEYINAAGETVKGTFKEALEESEKNIKAMNGKLEEYDNQMSEILGIGLKAEGSAKSWETAASEAIQGVQGDLDKLAAAYDEAFAAAQKNIQSTVGLTTELTNKTEITTAKLTEIWQNQTEWVNKYSENLQKAQKYGITDGLIHSLSDGSKESGQYINQIINEIESLNDTDAAALVKNLNDNFNSVKEAEGEFAKTVAAYKTDFSDTMDELKKKAETTIEEMSLSEGAREAARATVVAYVSEINKQVKSQSFVNLAGTVQSAVTSVLTPKGVFAYSQTPAIEENAKGTRYSADVFLAGEKGPELIVNAKGSQVFTAAETQRILSGSPEGYDGGYQGYSFDIPELFRQLAAERGSRLDISELGKQFEAENNNYSSSSAVNNITYSPTYQIKGESTQAVVDGVKKADKMSKAEFARMMKDYEKDVKRTAFG